MKSYEKLEISLEAISSSDIIATSADVTTGGVIMPWNKSEAQSVSFTNTDDISTPGAFEI